MPTEKEVYQSHADQYERLIQREDHEGNILKEIERLIALEGLDAVDLGAGTGRLTCLLAPKVRSIRAFDTSAHMLETAAESLEKMGMINWQTGVADHRQIPLEGESVDLVVSGWSFCYLAVWGGVEWKTALEDGLAEMQRVLKPNGMMILFETQGTGVTTLTPPAHLDGYFAFLAEAGFGSRVFRTDYRFASLSEAEELSAFFFGDEMREKMIQNNWQMLPEFTGVFWKGKE